MSGHDRDEEVGTRDALAPSAAGQRTVAQAASSLGHPVRCHTGFPRDFYINYHLYRHLFPTMALAGIHR